jgi:hypothetical protein
LVGYFNASWENDRTSEIYNPMAAAQIYSSARLQVMSFIIDNHLEDHVISCATDGVLSEIPVNYKSISKDKVIGTWRLSGINPALVLSPGFQLYKDKHPQGITYDRLLELVNDTPKASSWEVLINRPVTLHQAFYDKNDISLVGKIMPRASTVDLIDLIGEQTREFSKFPSNGSQLISGTIYNSEPIKI